MDAQTILVIFLSTALAVFLVLGIILLSFLIQITQKVKAITEKAERATEKAEDAVEFIRQATVPMTIARLVSTVVDKFGNKSKDRED